MLYELLTFLGNCLPGNDNAVIWYERGRTKGGTWETGVFVVSVRKDELTNLRLAKPLPSVFKASRESRPSSARNWREWSVPVSRSDRVSHHLTTHWSGRASRAAQRGRWADGVRAFCFSVGIVLLGTSSAIAAVDYAWWVTATFAPRDAEVEGIALRDLDRDWLRASVLRAADLPATATDPGEASTPLSSLPWRLISTVMASQSGSSSACFKVNLVGWGALS